MKSISKKRLIAVLSFTALYFLIVWLLSRFGISCVFRWLFGIRCPGCGMTHAALALLRLDFAAAFAYHPMVFSVPLLYLYVLTDGHVFKNKRLNIAVIILIFSGFLINYFIKGDF